MGGGDRRRGGWRAPLMAALLVAMVAPGGRVPAVHAAEEARIANSADGALLRSEPAYEAVTIGVLEDGTSVGLRTQAADTVYDADGQTRWWPVSTDLGEGWVAGFFLDIPAWEGSGAATSNGPAAAASAPASSTPAGANPPSVGIGGDPGEEYVPDGSAFARIGEPEGVNVRSEPGSAGEVVGTLRFDATVALRIDVLDTVYAEGTRWWPVAADGVDGWVSGAYLAPAAASPAEPAAEGDSPAVAVADDFGPDSDALADQAISVDPPPSDPSEPGGVLAGYVQVVTDDGGGLNIRADGAPDAERIGALFERDVVQVMEGPETDPLGNPWYLITDGATTGWVFGDFLRRADQPASPDDGTARAAPEAPREQRRGTATGSFMYPVERFQFTQGFGCSPYPWFYAYDAVAGCNVHDGIDLAAAMYTAVLAADGGTVDQAGWCDCGLGYYVKLDHGDGLATVYGHLAEWPPVTPGQTVGKGDLVGSMGSTGSSTGPHLHFSIKLNGVAQDPLRFLP